MNKIYKLAVMLSVCLMAFAGCAPEELSTDQFSDESVTFAAFAPNPVARGGALRITGSNLQKVNEVIIPGIDPITEIEVVKAGKLSEIRVIVPVDGPEVGPVSIVAEGKTYTSVTELTYSEPIIFTSFSTANTPAMPGDVVTIKGDYMNNIRAIQFEGGATVTSFEAQSRYELKVAIPSTAVTGKIILCDVDENNNPDGLVANMFYSEAELEIGKPTVKSTDRGELKSGAEITVNGEYLNMIEKVVFRVPGVGEGAVATDTESEFVLSDDYKSVKTTLPATVADGEVFLVSYAGDEFKAGAYTTVVPTEVAIAAETRYKAGLNAVVTGKDLDLVTGASLAGTALEYAYADNKITFAIPAAAVDGTVVLALANGKTVETAAIELVKPVITAVTPLELYAGDENIKITGSDLDLVTEATLGGAKEEFEYANDVLTVKTALTSVRGKLELTLANGTKVVAADAVNVKYHSKVIVTEMPAMQHIGQEVVLKGSNFSLVENIFIGEEKVTQYSVRTNEEVRFLMPWNKVGMYKISFLLFDGDTETLATQIEVGLELDIKTIWEGEMYLSWGGMADLSWGGYDWSTVKPGTVLTAYFDLDPAFNWWQVRFGNGSWAGIPSCMELGENIPMTEGATYFALTLTAADIDALVNQGGLVMTGANYTLKKLTLTTEISQEVDLWEGSLGPCDWSGTHIVAIPSDKQSQLVPGKTLGVEYECDPSQTYWQLEFMTTWWTQLPAFKENGERKIWDMDPSVTKFSKVISQEDVDLILNQGGLLFCGNGVIVKRVYVL